MRWRTFTLILVAALPLLTVAAGQAGLLAGRMPTDLGVHNGRLKAPSRTPNSVSSQFGLWPGAAHRALAEVDPLPLRGSGPATLQRLQRIVDSMPGAHVVTMREDYLHATFSSRWLGFVDDVEFWFDPRQQVVQVRSASRLGRRDFGVNRARVDAIRDRLSAP